MNIKKNPYADLLGMQVIEIGTGTARVQARVEEQHTNHLGYTHGGYLYSVADFAFELASNSHEADAVGLSTSMTFHRPSSVGAMLEAVAKESYLGKTIATYQIDVYSERKLIATFTGTVYRKSQ